MTANSTIRQPKRRLIGPLVLITVGGGLIYSYFGLGGQVSLPNAVDAPRAVFQSQQAEEVSYYADRQGSGRPLVLIHSINASPSTYEVKPLFEHYQGRRPVYALDLPGFGFSDRSPREYTPQLFADTIREFLADEVGEPADVVALSLSSEFAARSSLNEPDLFHSITVVSPTGLGPPRSIEREKSERILKVLSFPAWRKPLFNALTSYAGIRYFLGKNFSGSADKGLVDYAYATAHQPGAPIAPFNFLSGKLFTWDAFESLYTNVTVPALLLYDEDPNVSFDQLPDLLETNANWQAERIAPTMGLPHWEELQKTIAALEAFWEKNS